MNRHPKDQQRPYPEGASRTQWDHFTDKINNVLEDELGQRAFRNFMRTSNMIDGLLKLNFWIHCNMLLNVRINLIRIGELLKEADSVNELNMDNIVRLQKAHDSGNDSQIYDALANLKAEIEGALNAEYRAFVNHY